MPNHTYDLLVIGGGSAGFNAARVAHNELGKRVAIVDGARELGGLCILRGCMPSKTLLWMTEVLHLAKKGKTFGLRIPTAAADMRAMHARKKKIIGEFADYRAAALNSGKYGIYRANARFIDPHTVELADAKHTRLTAKKILVATGSRIITPPIPGLAETPSWTSDDVLELSRTPKSVIVLGGGIIACELAQFLRRIGARVTLIQRSPNILRDHSPEASGVLQQAFRDEGIELFTDTRIERVSKTKQGVRVGFLHRKGGRDGKLVTREAAHLFNALGRAPNTAGLNLVAAGVHLNAEGRVRINRWQQTTAPHIYAGGDVCGPYDIVHLAVAQGELAARHAFLAPAARKKLRPINHAHLLNVVFTSPALATIGRLESELREEKTPYIAASYPFNDHGKTILMDENYGYVKVIAEPKRGRLLGAEIVGHDAGELIHCFSTPLAMGATVRDMLRAPWYHPTVAEIVTYPLEEIAERIGAK